MLMMICSAAFEFRTQIWYKIIASSHVSFASFSIYTEMQNLGEDARVGFDFAVFFFASFET